MPQSGRGLPAAFADRPVNALLADLGDGRLHALLGRGAHLHTGTVRGDWTVVVGESDPRLVGRTGVTAPASLLPTAGGAWFLTADGPVEYEKGPRALSLRDGGLGKSRVVELAGPGSPANARTAWGVVDTAAGRRLYGWDSGASKWKPRDPNAQTDVSELQFAGASPVVLLADGRVCVYPEPPATGGAPITFFEPLAGLDRFGPAEVGGGQLFVGAERASPGAVWRYLVRTRSWHACPLDTADPIRQLHAAGDAVWAVKWNGEAGSFDPGAAPVPAYRPEFGPSAVPAGAGHWHTAEVFRNRFWFVRASGEGRPAVFASDPAAHTITAASAGLPQGFTPELLRASDDSLYLTGTANKVRTVHARSTEDWSPAVPTEARLEDIRVSRGGMVARTADGTVHTHREGKQAALLAGTAPAVWGRLATDRFGGLWGLTKQDGKLYAYTPATGTWRSLGVSATHLAVVPVDNATDVVYVAGGGSVRQFRTGAEGFRPELSSGLGGSEFRLDSDGKRVWALGKSYSNDLTLWAAEGGRPWENVWSQAPNERFVWGSAVWAEFDGPDLLVVTQDGSIWRGRFPTDKSRPKGWSKVDNGSAIAPNETITKVAKPAKEVFWALNDKGGLWHKPDSKHHWVRFRGAPDAKSSWPRIAQVLVVSSWLLLAGLGISVSVLFLTWPGENWWWQFWRNLGWFALLVVLLVALLATAAGAIIDSLQGVPGVGVLLPACAAVGVSATFIGWLRGEVAFRALGLLSLVAGVLTAAAWAADFYFAAPITAVRDKHFDKIPIRDFEATADTLTIRTDDGTWRFSIREASSTSANDSGRGRPYGDAALPQYLPRRAKTDPGPAFPAAVYPRTDEANRWRVDRNPDGGLSPLWKDAAGSWQTRVMGATGWVDESFRDIAVVDGRLLAVVPGGLMEFALDPALSPLRFTPMPDGQFLRLPSGVYHGTPTGEVRVFASAGSRWVPSAVPTADPNAIPWQPGFDRDVLHEKLFDANAGRFHRDRCEGLLLDSAGTVWLKTPPGWRAWRPELPAQPLGPPTPAALVEAPQGAVLAASPGWECRRTPAAEKDILTFTPKAIPNHAPVEDPLAGSGRWPDEDVRAVLAVDGHLLFGTALGVRRRRPGGGESLELPDRSVRRFGRAAGRTYCRTDEGDYVHTGTDWESVAETPTEAFPDRRSLKLVIGAGVEVPVVEETADASVTSRLGSFDASRRRFAADTIRHLTGGPDELWALTAAGVERFKFPGRDIEGARAEPTDGTVTRLCRRHDGGLWASSGKGEAYWRWVGSDWKRAAADDPMNPFTTPERGRVSTNVIWERRLELEGESHRLLCGPREMPLREGKFGCDYITGATAWGGNVRQATCAGIVSATPGPEVLPLPAPTEPQDDVRLAIAGKELLCRVPLGEFSRDADRGAWRPSKSDAFFVPAARFDGLDWHVTERAGERPRLGFSRGGSEDWFGRLNDRGQFPFDTIAVLAVRPGELWAADGLGIARFDATPDPARTLRPRRYWTGTDIDPDQRWNPTLDVDSASRLWLGPASDGRGKQHIWEPDAERFALATELAGSPLFRAGVRRGDPRGAGPGERRGIECSNPPGRRRGERRRTRARGTRRAGGERGRLGAHPAGRFSADRVGPLTAGRRRVIELTLAREPDRFARPAAPELTAAVGDAVRCLACAHRCLIRPGRTGTCGARSHRDGGLFVPWGHVAVAGCEPLEKKPFHHVRPGRKALTFGMLGCNYHCPYCVNWITSQAGRDPRAGSEPRPCTATDLVDLAIEHGAAAVVSSYNEPLISAEWGAEVFRLAGERGLLRGIVSNGAGTPEVVRFLHPHLDFCKIDLKGFDDGRYRQLGGELASVLDTIGLFHAAGVWLEVVTLVVPGFNDSDAELTAVARFLSAVSADIPWHVTAFHPDYKMTAATGYGHPTPAETLVRACRLGREAGLKFVYAGGLPGRVGEWEDTRCPECGAGVVRRRGVVVQVPDAFAGRCGQCGSVLPGRW